MAIITDTSNIIDEAFAEEKEQVEIEKSLILLLNKLFGRIGADFEVFYSVNGVSPDISQYSVDLQAGLKESYSEAYDKFSDKFKVRLENEIEKNPDNASAEMVLNARDNVQDEILAALVAYSVVQARRQSTYILETTQNVIDKSIQKVIEESTEVLTSKEIAKRAKVLINEENINRSVTIAQTEIEMAAETAKAEEVDRTARELETEVMDGVLPFEVLGLSELLQKTWVDVGDGKVRKWHRQASGQTVKIRQPFFVGGEYLMFPGDVSLGATIRNIANCRCKSMYI